MPNHMRKPRGSLTRDDLAAAIGQTLPRLSRRESARILEEVLTAIEETLAAGDRLSLHGFGRFYVRAKRQRLGRNPKTGTPAVIPARRSVYFVPSPVLIARINAERPADLAFPASRQAEAARDEWSFLTA